MYFTARTIRVKTHRKPFRKIFRTFESTRSRLQVKEVTEQLLQLLGPTPTGTAIIKTESTSDSKLSKVKNKENKKNFLFKSE